jgi:hypothetical protein
MQFSLALVACASAVACVIAGFVQVRRTTRRALGCPSQALLALARGDFRERRAAGIHDRAWEIVAEALAAPQGQLRIAALNERLLEIERVTDDVAAVPRAGARIALFTGLGCAALAVARVPTEAASVLVALTSMCAGVGGALFCAYLGRLASRLARQARNDYNRLAARVVDEPHVR